MFFIISGEVQVESDDGSKIYAEMGQNSFFGEVALFYDIRRTANIRAKSQCTVMELYKDVLDKLLKEYSGIENQMKAIAKENYDLFQKREHEIKVASSKNNGETEESAYNVEATIFHLEKVPLFKKCTKIFFNSLALHTSIVSFQKGENIIKKGDEANEMYIIINGKVQVVSEDGSKTFDTMKNGAFFGEVGVVNNVPRNEKIVAATNVDLIVLSRKSLDEVVKKYPECHKIILLEAEKRYKIVQKRVEKDNKKKYKLERKEYVKKQKRNSKDKSNKFSLNRLLSSLKKHFNTSNTQNNIKMQLLRDHKNSPYPSFYNLDDLQKVTVITQFTCPYFLNILRYLPIKDWFKLRCVCKKWNHIMKNPLLWVDVDFSSLYNQLSHKTISYALFACNSTTSLNFKGCWRLTNEDILTITQMCPHLNSLNLSNCWSLSDQGIGYVALKCQSLKYLNISFCSQVKGTCFLNHQMCNLTHIDISYCKQIGNECLEQLLARAPELQGIQFRRCNRITDFGIFLVARHCRRIRNIDLSDCDQITNKCLKWLSNNSIYLKCLDLTFCKHITNSGIYDLSLGNQEFESLILSYCSCLSDTAILCLHKSICKLKRLSIRGCSKMTDRVAFHVADNCPNLEWIDLSGCPSITSASKNKLLEKLPKIIVIIDCYPNKAKQFNYGTDPETDQNQNTKKIPREVSKEEFYTLMLNKKLATYLINSFSSESISSKLCGASDIQSEMEFNNNKLLPLKNSRPSELSFS
jgi:CRP-like cAMP-binding protein